MLIPDSVLLKHFKDHLNYDPNTGDFKWIKNKRSHLIGRSAGGVHKNIKYITIAFRINGKLKSYLAHRLAWFMTYGKWPEGEVDHLNGVRHDNRLCNLKDKTKRENLSNQRMHREGRLIGGTYMKQIKKWKSQIVINKKRIYLGVFNTELEAHQAYANKLSEMTHRTIGE